MSALREMMSALFRAKGLSQDEIERRLTGDLKDTPDNLLCGWTPTRAMASLETDWGQAIISEDLWSDVEGSSNER